MKVLVMLVCCLVAAEAVSFVQVALDEWALFKLQYAKEYNSSIEEEFRMKIYNENKHMIALHNQRFEKGQVGFSLAMNQYGDLLNSEFKGLVNGYRGYNKTGQTQGSKYLSPSNIVVPDSVDWTKKGYVTPIKDQGQCGSCWAFSATGSLEGQHFKATGKLVSLSEQQLVDCSKDFGNNGCGGGLMDYAFLYIMDNNGIDDEDSYQYNARRGSCHYNPSKVGATDTGFVDLPEGDETKLKEAVATIGPISVAIDASHLSFQLYRKGVYDEPQCDSQKLDHGVLVVGYGNDKTGGDYWLIKNSWGESWGDKGFMRMSRNKNNQCGVATEASYPLV